MLLRPPRQLPPRRTGVRVAWWLVRRLSVIAAQLVAVSVIMFAVLFMTPGDPARLLLGTNNASPEALAAIRAEHHLDEPAVRQYLSWLQDALHGNVGTSIQSGQPVLQTIGDRLPTSLLLAAYALVLVLLIAVPLGLLAGSRAGTPIDRIVTVLTTLGVSAPGFAVGIGLLYVFGVTLGWFPVFGAGAGFVDRLWHLTLPAFALALTVIALVVRQTRAAAMTVKDQDFIVFAKARGLPRRVLWGRYLLRNSALPVATSVGLVLGYFLTGAVLIEQTFALPGLGSLLVASISSKDIPVVQSLGLVAALFVLLSNLLADLSYAALDPRIRKQTFS
ncbi:ABC transporter permease [Kribbella endophytica]